MNGGVFMRITGSPNIQNVLKTYGKNVKKTEESEKTGFKSDKVEISTAARDHQVAMKALKDVPEVRSEKVNAIKEQISSGSYKPNAEQIAEHILKGLTK